MECLKNNMENSELAKSEGTPNEMIGCEQVLTYDRCVAISEEPKAMAENPDEEDELPPLSDEDRLLLSDDPDVKRRAETEKMLDIVGVTPYQREEIRKLSEEYGEIRVEKNEDGLVGVFDEDGIVALVYKDSETNFDEEEKKEFRLMFPSANDTQIETLRKIPFKNKIDILNNETSIVVKYEVLSFWYLHEERTIRHKDPPFWNVEIAKDGTPLHPSQSEINSVIRIKKKILDENQRRIYKKEKEQRDRRRIELDADEFEYAQRESDVCRNGFSFELNNEMNKTSRPAPRPDPLWTGR